MSASIGPATEGPYPDESTNVIYQLLFCDRPELFKENYSGDLQEPWPTIFNASPDVEGLARIAKDEQQESRVRVLAFNALRVTGGSVPQKQYFGTIIEVALPDGLDALAVFADGGARYINHSGKVIVVEGKPNPFDDEIAAVIETSKPIVAAIGPVCAATLRAYGITPDVLPAQPKMGPLVAALTDYIELFDVIPGVFPDERGAETR